ncbi:hypothetical protein JXQ70_13225 [bacterium]|nr:hypothetical protein [bacterium]
MKLVNVTIVIGIVLLMGIPASTSAQISEKIWINGYSSFEYEHQFGDEGKGDPNGSFDADLFDLVLNIVPVSQFRVAADISWEHGTATEDDYGNVALEYAFGELTLYDWLKFRAGKMFVHFGIYNEIHTAKPAFLTVKEPMSTNKNSKFGSELRFYPRWCAGLAVLGNGHISDMEYDYILQIANGDQENTNPYEEDDNEQKAFAGRFILSPLADLKLGLSFYTDCLTELDDEGEDTDERTALRSYGIFGQWTTDTIGLELEYVTGSIDPSKGETVSRYAYTAMVFYKLYDRYTPYIRYEYLDPDDEISDDQATLFIYGLNVKMNSNLYVKCELDTIQAGDNNQYFGDEDNDYTEFKGSVAIQF